MVGGKVKRKENAEWQENNIQHNQAPKCYSFSQDAASKSRSEDKIYQLKKKKSFSISNEIR